jgi:secondary thiamine-phosphate synthase enzyme
MQQEIIRIATRGRGTQDITSHVQRIVRASGLSTGLCHLFVRHTSCALMICENASPEVRADIEDWFGRMVPDGDPRYRHDLEGPDDMAAHLRTMLTEVSLTVPIVAGALGLGTWQGLYLYEHRAEPHTREIVVTLHGE